MNQQDAVIEINGGELIVCSDYAKLIAVGGKGYSVFAGELQLNLWQPYFLQPMEKLRIRPLTGGGIAYLAVHGGIRIKRCLAARVHSFPLGLGDWMAGC